MRKVKDFFESSFKNCFLVLFLIFTLVSCDTPIFGETTFTADSEFYWSDDAGASYGNRTKEYEVGENVYMQLIVKVDEKV